MATYYRSSAEIEGKRLSYGDILVFSKRGEFENVSYSVSFRCLSSSTGTNDQIFNLLQVKDPNKFAEDCYGYKPNAGIFPECNYRDYEALTRIAIALFKLCEGIESDKTSIEDPPPLYKVGDKVVIKDKRDSKCKSTDYPLGFEDSMLKTYGGKTVTIAKVLYLDSLRALSTKLCNEPYYYYIEEDAGRWNWTAPMFVDKAYQSDSKPKTTSKTSTIKKSTKTNKIIQSTMEKKSIFASFIDKYKAQFVPEKDDTLKISMDGNVCVPIDGEYVGIDKDDNLISYPKEACFDLPIYLLSKPFAQIQVGDIILVNKSYMKVLKKGTNGTLNCLTFSGYTRNKKEVKDYVLGQSFAKVVVNMFGNMQAAGFNPMMLAMCDGSMNVKDLLIMQMMQGGGGTQIGQMNPMLMMALMDKEGDSSILETMMMIQMMGGQFPNPFMPNDKK